MPIAKADTIAHLSRDDVAQQVLQLAAALGEHLQAGSAFMTTAESCTGGLIAAALTEVSGSSAWFKQGIVTYSNQAKQELLGVPGDVFDTDGAVSEVCVRAMAAGAVARCDARVAVAVSGVAGPNGGTPDKPVGTVWLAWALDGEITAECFQFAGDRRQVREQAVISALRGTIARVEITEKFKP